MLNIFLIEGTKKMMPAAIRVPYTVAKNSSSIELSGFSNFRNDHEMTSPRWQQTEKKNASQFRFFRT